ncbi:recombinase family protein [Paenibacillus sp. IHBB 3054]|uniref:recombinase family protein n=1 Tax=Paenibacillus sp. IHBB 3054 TaxID=3425689 RepID=UPI003F67B089
MIAIYPRVSTEEQVKSGFSIDYQIREGKKKAGTDEVKIYPDEGYSGEYLERPGMSQLRKDVKDGLITKIICLDPDRLARKLMLQLIITEEFEKRGVELIFINGEYAKTPEGQLFYSMRGAISEFEKAKITERMTSGRKEKADQGKVIKNSFLYGYDYDKENSRYLINEDEARVVRLIFNLFTKPNDIVEGINGIANYLTESNIPTKRGAKVWHKQVVRQILLNETYTGRFAQNKWNTEGMLGNKHKLPEDKVKMKLRPVSEWIYVECPRIITDIEYDYAQKLLGEARRRFAKEGLNQYLLSGLVRCGTCENTMTGRKSKNWGKTVFQYTDIKNTSGAKNKGCGTTVFCGVLDEIVWSQVHNWLNQPEEMAAASVEESQENYWEMNKSRIERELIKTKAARKKLIKLFSTDMGMGEEEIREELRELADREESLNKQLSELDLELSTIKKLESGKNMLAETLKYYLKLNPEELTFENKQALIRMLIKEVRYTREDINIVTF